MTTALAMAISELERMSEDEQERVARWLVGELAAERNWGERLRSSSDQLGKLAEETRRAVAEGKTTELLPNRL